MPSNKKQHYVPRFYLRNFSWNDRKAINIYNKKSDKLIANGNLSNQCYESYFYGKDLIIEKAFSDIEDVSSKIINEILNESISLPIMFTANHHTLLVHTLLQFSRTKYATSAFDEMREKICKHLLEKNQIIPAETLAEIEIKFDNSTRLALKAIAENIPLCFDLKYKLLKNTTPLQFLTSDHPVAFYNMCYEKSEFRSHTSLAGKGLQIFFPLSPQYLLVFYDGVTYKIGERKKFIVDVVTINDIRQINDLQWLNSLENIYFHHNFPSAELDGMRRRNRIHEYAEKSILNEYPEGIHPDGTGSSILHIFRPDHKIRLKLQCVRQLWKPADAEINTMHKPLRDPLICQLNDEFLELVEAKKYQQSEFAQFIKDKSNNFAS
jgi:hypothetical protein